MQDLLRLARESLPPLDRLELQLARWTSFVIVPLFAFANAGVPVSREALGGAAADPVMLGVLAGLVIGKATGVTGAAWLAVRTGIGRMPASTTWHHMCGVGLLAGIGFTVALFVAALSFPAGSPLLDSAKLGIFGGSLVAGTAGFLWLRHVAPHRRTMRLRSKTRSYRSSTMATRPASSRIRGRTSTTRPVPPTRRGGHAGRG